MNENPTVEVNKLQPITKFIYTLGVLPTSYLMSMTYQEQVTWLCNYLSQTVIPAINDDVEAVQELQQLYIDLQDYVNNYFDNLDVQDEINNKLEDMADSGELAEIIANFSGLITANTFSLQRIGRIINNGTNPKASDYNSSGVACTMQGGCRIDDEKVAYCLWDSFNADLNKNKIIVLNTVSGTIEKQQDFTYGWCNSLSYDTTNNKLYVGVRGTTSSGVSANNGIIKVLDYDTLSLENTITLSINCNSLSIYDDKMYVLEENTNKVYIYDLEGTYLNEAITLDLDMTNIYNQNIKVIQNYIYLLSTKPSNHLFVFRTDGSLLKTYNVPKFGGIYKIGELQWIDTIDDDYLMLGSTVVGFEENINQFFKFSLTKNIETNDYQSNNIKFVSADSSKNHFNPNGTVGNEFTSMNEIDNLSINLISIEGNNKEYDYTSFTNHDTVRIQNATFNDGLFIEYGKYFLTTVTIKPLSNTDYDACCFVRFSEVRFNTVTFNGNNTASYCIYANGDNNIIKFASPTFSNYSTSVFSNTIPASIVEVNNMANLPYIPRLYGREYPLMNKGTINQFKPATYNFNTDLTADQIAELFTNCTDVIIGYVGLNQSGIKETKFTKSANNQYTLFDGSIPGSGVDIRLSKCILTVSSAGVQINSNKTNRIQESDGTITCTAIDASTDNTANLFIQVRYVKLIVE